MVNVVRTRQVRKVLIFLVAYKSHQEITIYLKPLQHVDLKTIIKFPYKFCRSYFLKPRKMNAAIPAIKLFKDQANTKQIEFKPFLNKHR
jgi:hypothetical protein